MTAINSVTAQHRPVDFAKIKTFEQQLDDVMEITDTAELKIKLEEVEKNHSRSQDEVSQARLGIIYHETALNLSFLSKTEYKGFAKKSFDVLSQLLSSPVTSTELFPLIASYRASALALAAAETKKLKLVGDAFNLFEEAVQNYATVSYLPEFLRGSVAENLPWFFFTKRKVAKQDFQSIINKQQRSSGYANAKVMSFTFLARAKQMDNRKDRLQALLYLQKAIELDPHRKAGRAKAEELKNAFKKKVKRHHY